jgi:hypothetical protein
MTLSPYFHIDCRPGRGGCDPPRTPPTKAPRPSRATTGPPMESRGEDKLPEGDASPPASPKVRAGREDLLRILMPQACSSARAWRPSGKDAAPNKRSAAVPESARDPLISPPPAKKTRESAAKGSETRLEGSGARPPRV